jgi:circadian clock protein KaiC
MDVYTGKGGMLTGVARLEKEFRELLEARQHEQAIEIKKQELNQLRNAFQSQTFATEAQIKKTEIELKIMETENQISQEGLMRRESIRKNTKGEGSLDEHPCEGSQSEQEGR